MYTNNRNIYQTARNSAGLTQERASEKLGISVESIRAYETGQRIPPDDVVALMVICYDAQFLAYQHLQASTDMARSIIPPVQEVPLPQAVCHLLSAVSQFQSNQRMEQLLQMAADGRIDKAERPLFEEILNQDLRDIITAAMAVRYAQEWSGIHD